MPINMDLSSILAELKAAQEEFKQSERSLATAIFCQRVDEALERIVRDADKADFEHLVVGILIVIGSFNELLPHLVDGPLLTQLLDRLFRQCARVVLDIKWQQCDKDTPSQQSFRTSLLTCHQLMAPREYKRFSVLQTLMDNPWTHPVLSMVMGSEDDNEDGEGLVYIQAQDPEILKLRVELMQQENCDEFALNLCTWCLKHPSLAQDFTLRKTRFILLHRLNNIDRLQEECQTVGLEESVRMINSLLGKEEHKELCTMLAQTFLVQNWIKPSDNNTKKELLQLWIKLQYQADQDQDRFIASLWAVAKVSHSTEQLLLIIDAVREQCGDTFLQFCLDLCVFAINVDKGFWEKLKESNTSGTKELLARKRDMAQVCEKIAHIVGHVSPKASFCCALTAFSMVPTEQSLQAVCAAHLRRAKESSKSQCCSNCAADGGECLNKPGRDKTNREVNMATLYEVERLCGTLRPAYLSSESDFSVLYSMCKQYLLKENGEAVKSALVRRRSAPSIQPVPAAESSLADSCLPDSTVGIGSLSQRLKSNAVEVLTPVSKAADTVSHVSNVISPQIRDMTLKDRIHDTGLTSNITQRTVPQPAQRVQSGLSPFSMTTAKSCAPASGQASNANPIQHLVFKQLSTDTVQTLLHLIESGQISASHVNHVLTKNPSMSLQALNDLIAKAKESAAAQKVTTAQSSQQQGLLQQQALPQQQVQLPVHLQQVQQHQLHLQQQQQQQQNKAQAQSLYPQQVTDRQNVPLQPQYKSSRPHSDVPQILQSTSQQPARALIQHQTSLRQQTPQQTIAPQPKVGQPQVLDRRLSAPAQLLPNRACPPKEQTTSPVSTQQPQLLQGVPQITLPALRLTSSGEIQVTQPLHVMTFRQPVTVQSTGAGLQNAQIVMQSSTQMLTHLSGGSVMSSQQQPHIVRLPSASVTLANQITKAVPKTHKLIPKAPGPNTVSPQDITMSGTKIPSEVPAFSGDVALGNRHYSINNLLFTGEQQNSALSISLPDKLPEISVDSISDTLRALNDSSGVGGQVISRVPVQLAQNTVPQPVTIAQRPAAPLQPSMKQPIPKAPKQQSRSSGKKSSPKASVAQPSATLPAPVTSVQTAQTLMATLASFSMPAESVQAGEQTLPSFSSLFSSNRSPLPVPLSSAETVTSASAVQMPAVSLASQTVPSKKKGTGQSKGQRKGVGGESGGNKGAKKSVASSKEEMMRMLKQAMSLNMRKKEQEENSILTSLHPPGQQITSHAPNIASVPVVTSSSPSAWMVDYPSQGPPSSQGGLLIQQSSQPGPVTHNTVPSYPATVGVSQYSTSLMQHHAGSVSARTTSLPAVAVPIAPLPASLSSNAIPSAPVTSAGSRQMPSFLMPEQRGSKLLNMLKKQEQQPEVSETPVSRNHDPYAFDPNPDPGPVFREQKRNRIDSLAGNQTVQNTYRNPAIHGSSMNSSVSNITESVSVSCSTKHPSVLPSTSRFAVSGHPKDPTVLFSSKPTTAGYSSLNPAVSYSTVKAAVTSLSGNVSSDIMGTCTVASSAPSFAGAYGVGNPSVPDMTKIPAVSVTSAIPSVGYETCTSSSPVSVSNTTENSSIAPYGGVPTENPLASNTASGSVQGPFAAEDVAESSGAMSMFAGQFPQGVPTEAERVGNKAFATYRCLICSKAFMTLDALRVHVKRNCKPPSDQPDVTDGRVPPTFGGLETSTVFQCMRCFELCISEAGIRAHKQVCSKAPKTKPKSKPKAKAKPKPNKPNKSKPKQTKSAEERATEARVMELLNKCLGENREKLFQETEAEKARKEVSKKKPSKRKNSVDGQAEQSNDLPKSKKPKKENTSSQSSSSSSVGLPVQVLQDKESTAIRSTDLKPLADSVPASLPPFQTGLEPSASAIVPGSIQAKEEKPKPKRKYYPKKKKVADTETPTKISHRDQNSDPQAGTSSEAKKSVSNNTKQPKLKEPKREAVPPCPRFKKLSGSGGRSFFKCLNCGQTLCSIENFNDHWLECIKKKPLIVKPSRVSKVKKSKIVTSTSDKRNSTTYSSLASIDAIIQSVASGSYSSDVSENEQLVPVSSENLSEHPEVTSPSVAIRQSFYEKNLDGNGPVQTSSSRIPSKACEVFSTQFSEQGDSEFIEQIEVHSSQVSIESEVAKRAVQNETINPDTELASSSFQTVDSESSGLPVKQIDSVPPSFTALDVQQREYVLASQFVQSAVSRGSSIALAYTEPQVITRESLIPETARGSAVELPKTAVSHAVLSSPPLVSHALSSQITPSDELSVQTGLSQGLTSQNTGLEVQAMETTMSGVLFTETSSREQSSHDKHFTDAASVQAGVLRSHAVKLDMFQKSGDDASPSQTEQRQTLPWLDINQSDHACKNIASGLIVPPATGSDDVSLNMIRQKERGELSIEHSGIVSEKETVPNPENCETKSPFTSSAPPKSESTPRSRQQKDTTSSPQRSRSASKPTNKTGERKRSNSAPKPSTEEAKKQPPTDAVVETKGCFTSPKPADDAGEEGCVTPENKPDPPQDIKDVKYCGLCNRYYSRHWVLVRHFAGQHVQAFIQMTETGTLYLCPFCYEVFPQRHQFKTHVMTHADLLLRLFLDEEYLAALEANKIVHTETFREDHPEQVPEDTVPVTECALAEEPQVICSTDGQVKSVPEVEQRSSENRELQDRKEALETAAVPDKVSLQPDSLTVLESTKDKSKRKTLKDTSVVSPTLTSPRTSKRKQAFKPVKSPESRKQECCEDEGGRESGSSDSKHKSPNKEGKTAKALSQSKEETNVKNDKQTPELVALGKFCRVCQRFFSKNWGLMQHIARQHVRLYTTRQDKNKVIYTCSICQKAFPNKAGYMVHCTMHTKIIIQRFNEMELPLTDANGDPVSAETGADAAEEQATVREHESDNERLVESEENVQLQENMSDGEAASKNDTCTAVTTLDFEAKPSGVSEIESHQVMLSEKSPHSSDTKTLTAVQKRTENEDVVKPAENKSDDREQVCDNSVIDKVSESEAVSAEVCAVAPTADTNEPVECGLTTASENEKTSTSDGTGLGNGETNVETSSDIGQQQPEKEESSNRNRTRSSAAASSNSGSRSSNSQLKKKMSQRLRKMISKQREVLKQKTAGVKKRADSHKKKADLSQAHYCRVCHRNFCRNWVLAQHITSQHLHLYTMTQTKSGISYVCHLCQKSFGSPKGNYMYHVASHSGTIIEHFNGTDSLKEVKFGGRTYKITRDGSEVPVQKQDHTPARDLNKSKTEGLKKGEKMGTVSMNKGFSQSAGTSRAAKVKTAPLSPRKRRNSDRISGSKAHNTEQLNSSEVRGSPEPASANRKRKSVGQNSAENRRKQAKVDRTQTSKVNTKITERRSEKGNKTNVAVSVEDKTRSAGDKCETTLPESDATVSEQKADGTKTEKEKSDKGEDCQEETVHRSSEGCNQSEPKHTKPETSQTDDSKSDQGGDHKKSGEPDQEQKHNDPESQRISTQPKAEKSRTDKMNLCNSEEKTEDSFCEATESKVIETRAKTTISDEENSNKDEEDKSCVGEKSVDASKVSVKESTSSATENNSVKMGANNEPSTKESDSSASKNSCTKSGANGKTSVKNSAEEPESTEAETVGSSALSLIAGGQMRHTSTCPWPEVVCFQTTAVQKPSFMDSFVSFVSTRSSDAPLQRNYLRRRYHSGNSSPQSRKTVVKDTHPEQNSSERPAQTSYAEERLNMLRAAELYSASSGKSFPDSVISRARLWWKNRPCISLNRRHSCDQISTRYNEANPLDSLSSEHSRNAKCSVEVNNSSKAPEEKVGQCNDVSGFECSEDSVRTLTCGDEPSSLQRNTFPTSEQGLEPSASASAAEGGQDRATIVHSMSSDVSPSPFASHASVESPVSQGKMTSTCRENADQVPGIQDASAQRKALGVSVLMDNLPMDTTLTGILNKAIDMAYQQENQSPVVSDSSVLLPHLLTERADVGSTTPVRGPGEQSVEQPESVSSSTGDISVKVEVSSQSEETKEPYQESEPSVSAQDPQPSHENSIAVVNHQGTIMQPSRSPKESIEEANTITTTGVNKLQDSPVAALDDLNKTRFIPEGQHSPVTSVVVNSVSTSSAEGSKEKSFVAKDHAIPSSGRSGDPSRPVSSEGNSTSDVSEFPNITEEQSSESEKSAFPVFPSSAETENQGGAWDSSKGSDIRGGAVSESEDTVEDCGDTCDDAVNVIEFFEDHQSPQEHSEPAASVNKNDVSEDHDNEKRKTAELYACNEAEGEKSLELEDHLSESGSHFACSDPSSVKDMASLPLSDATTQSALAMNAIKSVMHERNAIESVKEVADQAERKTAVDSSHRMSSKQGKFPDDIDPYSDLPDLCIEPDPQSKIINTGVKVAENKKADCLSSNQADKIVTKVASSEVNSGLKKNVFPSPGKDNPDVVMSTFVGDYEVTVKKLRTSKSVRSAYRQTYCARMEVKTEKIPEDEKDVEAGPTESPVRKPMLGVKPLRNVHQPEPFVWDEEGEEDGSKRARNERSLRAFQQQVNVAPFSWDMDAAGEVKNRVCEKGTSSNSAGGAGPPKVGQNELHSTGDDLSKVKDSKSDDSSLKKDHTDAEHTSDRQHFDVFVQETNCSSTTGSSTAQDESKVISPETLHVKNSSDERDSASSLTSTLNNQSGDYQDVHIAKNSALDTRADERDTNASVFPSKILSNKPDTTEVDKPLPVPSVADNSEESAHADNTERVTRARATVKQGQLVTHSRTLRSGSSDDRVQKRTRPSTSKDRKNEPIMKRPFRKSRSCDIDNGQSVDRMHSEASLSAKSVHTGKVDVGEMPHQRASSLNTSTKSYPFREKSRLHTDGQIPTNDKCSKGIEGQQRNRSGLDKVDRRKTASKSKLGVSGRIDRLRNGQQRVRQSALNSSLDPSSKSARVRDRSSDKKESQRVTAIKPCNVQNANRTSEPENDKITTNSGTECKVLRGRDITPDKVTSHQAAIAGQPSESESQKTVKTRCRRTSSSSNQNGAILRIENVSCESAESTSLSSSEHRPKDTPQKPTGSQQNLSAMVRRRQHLRSWHKTISKPAKKRQSLSSQAPKYEIIRVEPAKDGSDHRRTRSSDRDVEPPPRTVHTRVSVGTVKPGLHYSSPKRTSTPAGVKKRSADSRFSFGFKRARRRTDAK